MMLPSFAVIASWQSPRMSLEVPRIRSPQAAVWQHALAGDILALQQAFREGSASPSDIHGPTGRTLLHVRLIFLYDEGTVVGPTDGPDQYSLLRWNGMEPIQFLLEQRTDPYIVDHNGWYATVRPVGT